MIVDRKLSFTQKKAPKSGQWMRLTALKKNENNENSDNVIENIVIVII
jgi:hypothetical protein